MRVASLLLCLGLAGCSPPVGQAEAVRVDRLPEPVRAAAKERLPGVVFSKAWKGPGGNYSLRGKAKQDKKTRSIDVSPTGEVLRVD
jgi:hypothetical protein